MGSPGPGSQKSEETQVNMTLEVYNAALALDGGATHFLAAMEVCSGPMGWLILGVHDAGFCGFSKARFGNTNHRQDKGMAQKVF